MRLVSFIVLASVLSLLGCFRSHKKGETNDASLGYAEKGDSPKGGSDGFSATSGTIRADIVGATSGTGGSFGDDVGPQQHWTEYAFPECCGGNSVCAHLDAIADEDEVRFIRESCDEDELCVPKHIGLDPTGYGVDLVHCMSWGGGEGRCLSECMSDVIAASATLKRDSDGYEDRCEPGFLCAPCYDPVTGDSTDACTEAGDAPTQPPYQFQECCLQGETNRGTCVPSALVSPDDQNRLVEDHAPDDVCDVEGQIDEDFLCAPNEMASDPNLILPSDCTVSILFITMSGLCMADCFSPEDLDLQGSCEDPNDECLPCSQGAPCE